MVNQGDKGIQNHEFVALALAMIFYTMGGIFLHAKHITLIHEHGLGILIGLAYSIIGMFVFGMSSSHESFNEQIFFYVLLPPIIFCEGFNTKKGQFFKNFAKTFFLGTFATIINFVLIYNISVELQNLQFMKINGDKMIEDSQYVNIPRDQLLLLSVIFSSSDNISATSLINEKSNPQLFNLKLGEGIVNEAMVLVLFQKIQKLYQGQTSDIDTRFTHFLEIFSAILQSIFGSIIIGLVAGIFTSLLFKKSRSLSHGHHAAIAQIILLNFTGYVAYAIAEMLHLSGAFSLLTATMFMGHYTFYNMTKYARQGIHVVLKVQMHMAEGFLFVYMGSKLIDDDNVISVSFILIEILVILICRIISIIFTSLLYSFIQRIRKKSVFKLGFFDMLQLILSGMLKGGISFALVTMVDGTHKKIIQSTVDYVILISTLILFCFFQRTFPILEQKQKEINSDSNQTLLQQQSESSEQKSSQLKNFDRKYLKPFFIQDYSFELQQCQKHHKSLYQSGIIRDNSAKKCFQKDLGAQSSQQNEQQHDSHQNYQENIQTFLSSDISYTQSQSIQEQQNQSDESINSQDDDPKTEQDVNISLQDFSERQNQDGIQ